MRKILFFLSCLIALISFMRISVGGEFYVADFLAVLTLPFALISGGKRGLNFLFLPLGCALIIYALVLDDSVGTSSANVIRALGRNVTVVINFISFSYLVSRWPREAAVMVALAGVSIAIMTILQPNAFSQESPWKGGVSQGCLLALSGFAIIILERVRRFRLAAILAVCCVALAYAYEGMHYDSRTSLFVGLAGASLGLMFGLMRRVSRLMLVAVSLGLAMLVPLYFEIYYAMATSGALGPDAALRMQIISKAHGGDTSVTASRQATFDALDAAVRAFPVGMGSFPPDVSYHSNVITATVETGAIGLLFWLNIIGMVAFKASRSVRFVPGRDIGVFVMLAISFIGTILFDPLQGFGRLYTPLLFVLLANFLAIVKTQTRIVPPSTRLPSKRTAGRVTGAPASNQLHASIQP